MSRSLAPSFVALALLLAPGCYADEADDPGLNEFRTTATCTTCTINNNSPEINEFEIPELHLDGRDNDDLVSVDGIRSPLGDKYPLQVRDEQFAVLLPNDQLLTGADLVGWTIQLDSPDGGYDLEIATHDLRDSFVEDGPPITIYALKYESHLVPGEILNVCPDSLPDEATVTLIRDETYDHALKEVHPEQYAWFTLACADQAAYKMQRLNYGPNSVFGGASPRTSAEQRQATLKMITADYCGTGLSFTEQGTELLWNDVEQTVGEYEPIAGPRFEALWSSEGALCLDHPRLVDKKLVEETCTLPKCSAIDEEDPRIVWRTATP